MSRNLLLMMKNEQVMKINLDTAMYEVINERLVPFTLREKLGNHYLKKIHIQNMR